MIYSKALFLKQMQQDQQLKPKVYSSEFLSILIRFSTQLSCSTLSLLPFFPYFILQIGFAKILWGSCLGCGCLTFLNYTPPSARINVSDLYALQPFKHAFSSPLSHSRSPYVLSFESCCEISSKQSLLRLHLRNYIFLGFCGSSLLFAALMEAVEMDLQAERAREELKKLANLGVLGIMTLFLLLERSVGCVPCEDFLTESSIRPTYMGGSKRLWAGDRGDAPVKDLGFIPLRKQGYEYLQKALPQYIWTLNNHKQNPYSSLSTQMGLFGKGSVHWVDLGLNRNFR